MKIFNKFANKNAGKPGLTRRWGGGRLDTAYFLPALLGLISSCHATLPIWSCDPVGWTLSSGTHISVGLGRSACQRGEPVPFLWYPGNSAGMGVTVPLVPDFPGDLVDASIASPAVGMLSKTLWKDTCYFVNYLKCNHNQKDFLDGWVYGYLEEFNSCGWGTAVPSEKLPPRVTWVICGSAWSLGVLGLGYFIGVYKKSKSKISVINVKGL